MSETGGVDDRYSVSTSERRALSELVSDRRDKYGGPPRYEISPDHPVWKRAIAYFKRETEVGGWIVVNGVEVGEEIEASSKELAPVFRELAESGPIDGIDGERCGSSRSRYNWRIERVEDGGDS